MFEWNHVCAVVNGTNVTVVSNGYAFSYTLSFPVNLDPDSLNLATIGRHIYILLLLYLNIYI